MELIATPVAQRDAAAADALARRRFAAADFTGPGRVTLTKSSPSSPLASPEGVDLAVAFPGAMGSSAELRATLEKAARLARSRVSILLQGETGVGKEVLAQGIHALSPMHQGPLVTLNCGGLTRDLLASELFGHVDGAFTGARRGGMTGKIESADGGTLFLDELGEMPLDLQPHFLRVLEDGHFYRLGDTKPRRSRFRLIAATNRDLREEVAAGRFRSDLFYRISVTSVLIPALRERRGDIRTLARSFVRHFCHVHEVEEKVFDGPALDVLESYPWPGNVRELRNVAESLVLTVPDNVIGVADLPEEISIDDLDAPPVPAALLPAPPTTRGTPLGRLDQAEFDTICSVLRTVQGNATQAARRLGMAKSTLYLKLKKYALDGSLEAWRSA